MQKRALVLFNPVGSGFDCCIPGDDLELVKYEQSSTNLLGRGLAVVKRHNSGHRANTKTSNKASIPKYILVMPSVSVE